MLISGIDVGELGWDGDVFGDERGDFGWRGEAGGVPKALIWESCPCCEQCHLKAGNAGFRAI